MIRSPFTYLFSIFFFLNFWLESSPHPWSNPEKTVLYYKIRQMLSVSVFSGMCIFLLFFVSLPSQHCEGKLITFSVYQLAGSLIPLQWRRLGRLALCPAHCALEAVVVVDAAPLAEATVKREFCTDSAEVEVAWRLATGAEFPVEAAAAETKLTGLLVSRERFWGFRNRGAVTMLGAPPALANTRFPVASSDVIGREPPEARATGETQETGRKREGQHHPGTVR